MVVAELEFLSVLCGISSRLAVKVFDLDTNENPLTAKFAKESRKVREEILIEALLKV